MHLSLHRYPLGTYSTWLLSRRASSSTAAAYVHRVRGVLGAVDCPNDSPEALLGAAERSADVEAALASLSPSMQAQARAAWRSFTAFLHETSGGTVPLPAREGGYRRPGGPARDARYPLDTFQAWLEANRASPATRLNYANRVRAVLGALEAPSDRMEDVGLVGGDEARISEYLARLSPSTRVQVVSAWRSYAAFLETRGASGICNLATPRGYRRPATFQQDRPPEQLQLPERVRQAIWYVLAKGHRPLPTDVLLGLTWRRVHAWQGTAPHNASQVDLYDNSRAVWHYFRPLTAWLVLWEWAAGPERRAPLHDQPILVAREGVTELLDPSLVLAVAAAGKRGAIPMLQEEPPERWRPWEPIQLPSEPAPVMPPPFRGAPVPGAPLPPAPPAEEVDDDPLAAWEKEGSAEE